MSSSSSSLTLRLPDDFHVHLRDTSGVLLQTVTAAATNNHRILVMPNLQPPVTNAKLALEYYERIKQAYFHYKRNNSGATTNTSASLPFQPLMSLYLTHQTTAVDIEESSRLTIPTLTSPLTSLTQPTPITRLIHACKLYPAGATTHSNSGIDLARLNELHSVFLAMEKHNILLLIHGETTTPTTDIYYREVEFVQGVLPVLLKKYPALKIVMEHITTKEAVEFIIDYNSKNTVCTSNSPFRLAATLTVQHLLFNRNALFSNGLQVHNYCLPILKSEPNRLALLNAITHSNASIRRYFFAGTDSAPHSQVKKECNCACAGCYTQPISVELYAEVFDSVGKLEYLEQFLSIYGAEYYGLKVNEEKVQLVRSEWKLRGELILDAGNEEGVGKVVVVPLRANTELKWKINGKDYSALEYSASDNNVSTGSNHTSTSHIVSSGRVPSSHSMKHYLVQYSVAKFFAFGLAVGFIYSACQYRKGLPATVQTKTHNAASHTGLNRSVHYMK